MLYTTYNFIIHFARISKKNESSNVCVETTTDAYLQTYRL